ncbi:MAG: pirin family protein [Acidimicrobiales bacterium]|nr:pirin family protein [Acidimicrobiales bacterium]
MSTSPVLETVPLGLHWPTLDPFLFCAHHDDEYPAGDESMAPAVPVDDRDLGMDFSGKDGWSMYHGDSVPGFPGHPHRGFETVTYVRNGLIDHSDSLGAAARFGRGDVQWVTAGSGIVHSEMFPLVHPDQPNPLELFQIWLNLPADDKMVDPYFTMLWDHDIPRAQVTDDQGNNTEVTVIAGRLGVVAAALPPPSSWAARDDSHVAIWHIRLDAGATWSVPATLDAEINRVLYLFEGDTARIADTDVDSDTGVVLRPDVEVEITAGDEPVEALLLQGRPIGEPVAQYGPFVMNTRAEIQQAMADFQTTGFGGWPWDDQAPTHGRDRGRFARHVDGRVEELSDTGA